VSTEQRSLQLVVIDGNALSRNVDAYTGPFQLALEDGNWANRNTQALLVSYPVLFYISPNLHMIFIPSSIGNPSGNLAKRLAEFLSANIASLPPKKIAQ